MCYLQINTVHCQQNKWNTKEDMGKSMKMNCAYCGMPKGTSLAEAMLNSEKIKHALGV